MCMAATPQRQQRRGGAIRSPNALRIDSMTACRGPVWVWSRRQAIRRASIPLRARLAKICGHDRSDDHDRGDRSQAARAAAQAPPKQSDRELLESLARIQLGREASARVKDRFAGVSSEEIEREAVKAAREVRRERAAARQAEG